MRFTPRRFARERGTCFVAAHRSVYPRFTAGFVSIALLSIVSFSAEPPADPLAVLTPIAGNSAEIDLGNTALLIAHALIPAVDVTVYGKRLDALASELRQGVADTSDPKATLGVMSDVIYKRWGFADRKILPADVFVSFADVLDKRQWNCFGMSVLYVALGERIGLPLQLVSGRGHALVFCPGTRTYIETTANGRVYENTDYLGSFLPFPCLDPREYKPLSSRESVAVLLTQTGGALFAQGKSAEAQSCFQHALAFDPNHAEAHAALGFLFAQIGPVDRAIESFNMAIKADPSLREAYGGLGAVLRAKGDLKGAVDAYQKAIALCVAQPEPVFNLGQVLYESGDLPGSIDAFRKYTELAPGDPDGFVRLAFPLEDTGKLDEALAAYESALRLNPRNADALVNSGAIREKQGKMDAARSFYEKALQTAPNNALAYAGLGRVFAATNHDDDSAKAFTHSIELDAMNPATWIDFAKLEKKRRNVPEAIAKLKHALEINPSEPETHIELARIYVERKDIVSAKDHAQIAQRLGAVLPEDLKELTAKANP